MDYQQKQLSLLLSLLMNNTEDAIWLVDAALQTLDINPVACQLLNWDAERVIGQNHSTIMSKNIGMGHQVLAKYLEQAVTSGQKIPFNGGVKKNKKNNQSALIEGVAHPLLDREEVIGAAAIFRPASPSRCVEQMQADFIALASHNLRTPLMSIQASLDYVLAADADKNNLANYH